MEEEYQYDNENELYEIFEKLGEGGFSTVHRCHFLPTGEEMALKIIKDDRLTETVMSNTV